MLRSPAFLKSRASSPGILFLSDALTELPMTLADSILWSFARSALIAGVALWPVAVLLRQMAASRTVRTRRVWLLLAVFPFFVPELLIGFNYRLTATQLSSGASPVVAAICTESLYALLQLVRCVAVGVALSLLLPRSEVTREAMYSWDLLRPLSTHDWRRGWLWLRLTGRNQPIFPYRPMATTSSALTGKSQSTLSRWGT